MNSTPHPPSPILRQLVGHEARRAALARAFANRKIPQTLLLSGPPSIGKWTLARRYAQLLLCPNPVLENELPAACGHCRVCHQVEIETFPDFKVYRPLVSSSDDERDWVIAPRMMSGSILPIAVARKFGDEALRKPLVGPRKVMVIVQADRMNDEAQNALLKTFEEPIPGLSIFLLCDNADGLRATIRSRCWHVPLSLATDEEIADWLRASIAASNSETNNDTQAHIAAAVRAANGRAGTARREFERLQSASTQNRTGQSANGQSANGQSADGQVSTPRLLQAEQFVVQLLKSRPVGALKLTEEALRLAKVWWEEDQAASAAKENKKGDAKIVRSSVARFLDELAIVYRARWAQSMSNDQSHNQSHDQSHNMENRNDSSETLRWSVGLDQIRKTRHYILHNANTNLALDVLFGRLISGT